MKKVYLSIEITSSRIRYICVDRHKKSLRIFKAQALPYKLDPNHAGELTRLIKEIIRREAVSPIKILVVLSRHDTLLRYLLLPKMNQRELDEAIATEIEKIPTFAGKEFDFVTYHAPAVKEKMHVVFAALDQDILRYVMGEIQDLKIPFRHLEISPLNLKELVYQKKGSDQTQVLLVVNDLTTYCILFKNHQYRLLYQAAIGTEHLYPNKAGMVSETFFANLVSEIQRVLKYYLNEHKNESIEKVWLVWDKSHDEGLGEKIQSKLEAPVEVFSPNNLPNVEYEPSLGNNPIHVLALTPVYYFLRRIRAYVPFDFFFRAFHLKRYIVQVALVTLTYVTTVGIGTVMYCSQNFSDRGRLAAEIDRMNKEMTEMRAASSDLYAKRDRYMEIREGLLNQATFIKKLNRVSWSQVFSVVSDELPQNIGLTSFEFRDGGSATFTGEALTVETIAELMRSIDSSAILTNPQFDFLREKTEGDHKVFSFGIFAQLRSSEQKTGRADTRDE